MPQPGRFLTALWQGLLIVMEKPFRVAGALLISTRGDFLLQRRDNEPHVSSPGMLSIFGGMAEDDETFEQAMLREISEETGLNLAQGSYEPLISFTLDRPGKQLVEGGFYLARNVRAADLQITEGSLETVTRAEFGKLVEEVVPTTMLAISTYLANFT